MNGPRQVAIIGLGLMGGSIAQDLVGSGTRILAYEQADEVARAALESGSIDEVLDASLHGIERADLVILAVPVDQTLALLTRLSRIVSPGTVLTDVGSTKATIVAEAERVGLGAAFVGSHPLAGDHRSGWGASRPGLYRGAPIFVCPGEESAPAAVERVLDFWSALGGHCQLLDPREHDTRMAWVSHLPQIASTAIANAVAGAGYRSGQVGPGGRDMTRLAASSPAMWSAICRANQEPIQQAISALQEQLADFRAALEEGDPEAIFEFFSRAREWIG